MSMADHHLSDPAGFRKRLAAARKDSGLSQRALSGFAGCSPSYVHLIEKGERLPSLQSIQGLATGLGVTVEYLLSGKDDELRLLAREIVSLHRQGAEIPEELIERLDRASMPGWYSDYLDWLDSDGDRPASVPVKIPAWITRRVAERKQNQERRAMVKGEE